MTSSGRGAAPDASAHHTGSAPCGPRSKEIRHGREHGSDHDERDDVGNEIGVDHQREAAHQWDDGPLLSSVKKKTETDRTEQQPPEKYARVHDVAACSPALLGFFGHQPFH